MGSFHDSLSAMLASARAESPAEQPAASSEPLVASGDAPGFEPEDHTVAQVLAYIEEHPDELDEILDAEAEGRARSGILDAFDG